MNTTKPPKKVSDLTSLFEEKNSEVIAQPRAVNVVSPSKKPATATKAGTSCVRRPSPKPRLSRSDLSGKKATKSRIPSQTSSITSSSASNSSSSGAQLFTDIKAPSKTSDGHNSPSSGKVSRTIQSYEGPCENSLYLHGRKKMLSASDITGSEKSLATHEMLSDRNEDFPLEHTSSAENLFFSQKANVKHLILERQQSLEDTRKSPIHNDLKECEFIMKRFADAKMKDLRNKFERSVDDSSIGGTHDLVKSSSANIRGISSTAAGNLTLRGDSKSSHRLAATELFKARSSTLGSTKTSYSEFLNSTLDKNISSLQNIKFDIDSSCKVMVSERTAPSTTGTSYKSQTAENILQKRKLANILKNAANDVRLPSRVQPLNKSPSSSSTSSSSSTTSSETANDSSFNVRKKRGSYENVIQSGQVKFLTSKISGSSASVDSGKCTDINGVNNGCDDSSDIYDDIANTLDHKKSLETFKARRSIQQNNSPSHKEPQMNGRNSANSKSTSLMVNHINTKDDDDDDNDDFYETIDVPSSLKSTTKSVHLSWVSAQNDSGLSSMSSDKDLTSVFKRKKPVKRKKSHTRFSLQDTYINFPLDLAMKKGDVSETPPPIPPRDKIPEAPPLPPRKQEEALNLKTVVPLPVPSQCSPKNNRLSSSQESSSNDSLPGSKTKIGGEMENRKLSCQLSEDYVCMSSPDFLTNSSENNIADLNEPDYNEDNLYGVNNERYNSCFGTEPLYQFCGTDIKKQKKGVNRNSHIYCEIGSLDSGNTESKVSNTSTSESQGSESLGSEFLRANSQRTLWHEMPQVKNSGLLQKISDPERKCQEAIFEVITSEASYLKSLNILMTTFLLSPEFSDKSSKSILSRQERHEIFSNIGAVRETSEKFLADLEARWKKSAEIHDICDIITNHVQKNTFNVYIRYCTNMTYQERMYNKLLKRPEFEAALKSIERKDACQRLPMKTFLLLPMQRITRIPLLIDSIRHRLDPNTDRYRSADIALQAINKIVKQCNEGARQMECMEELIALQKQMQFKVKEFPLISASRTLVKKGEAIEVVSESASKTIFKRSKPTKNPIYLFLFNDLLLIAKKRGNHYDVVDYCSRAFLDPQRIRDPDKCKLLPHGVPPNVRFLILLVMLENFEHKRVEMILAFNSENDCERWLTAVTPVTVDGNERIYSAWDCPEVEATCSYKAYEKDELSLETNDVVTVFRKLNDGWYYGERSHDGETGWFPSEVTKEIVGEHSRARNMRLKYQVEGNIEVE